MPTLQGRKVQVSFDGIVEKREIVGVEMSGQDADSKIRRMSVGKDLGALVYRKDSLQF